VAYSDTRVTLAPDLELFRKLGGMLNYRLHTHCNIGTKHLIEEYVDTVCSALENICDTDWGTDFSIQVRTEIVLAEHVLCALL
jgi:quinol monooxygenase YgiN